MTVVRAVAGRTARTVARWPAPAPRPEFRLPRTLMVRHGVIIAGLLVMLPCYWMANSALKDIHELSSIPPTLYPHVPAFDNFVRAVTYIPFGTFLRNSVVLTAGVTIGSAISNPLIAYGFSRIKWPGRDFVFGS